MSKWVIPILVLALVVFGMIFLLDDESAPARARPESGATIPAAGPAPDFSIDPTAAAPAGAGETAAASTEPATAVVASGDGIIAGRVVDDTGAPIEGAALRLRPMAQRTLGDFPFLEPAEQEAAEVERTSDAEGLFRFEGLDGAATFVLLARAEGWVGARRRDLKPGGDPLEIVLGPGETVTGIVVDPDGRRAGGALVQAGPTVTELGGGFVVPVGGQLGEGLMPETTAAADGSFALRGIPHGRFSIQASHGTWSPSTAMNLMQGQNGVTLELRPNTIVEGRVIDSLGAPVAGATVRSMSMGFFGGNMQRNVSAESDATGAFRLEGLPPGTLHLIARAEGYPMRDPPEPFAVAAGETLTGVEIVLARGARVTGTIVDPAGAPLAGARVTLRRDGDGQGQGFRMPMGGRSATSGADGTFAIQGIDPETDGSLHRVHVAHPHFAETDSAPFAVASGAEIELGTLALAEGITISGRITDLEGRPVPEANVTLVEGGGAQEMSGMSLEMMIGDIGGPIRVVSGDRRAAAKSDAEGNYRILVPDPGSYRVAARAPARQRVESDEIAVGDRSIEGIDLALPPALRIEGTVVDERGLPCAEVVVHATAEPRGEESERTGEDGRFVIDGLSAGVHRLDIRGEGWSLAGESPEIEAGATDVSLVAIRPGRIAGRIVDRASGRPVTTFTIRSNPDFGRGGGRMYFTGLDFGGIEYHDPDGRFLLEGLAPGDHRISVRAPGRVETTETIGVASGSDTETTIALELAGVIVGRVVDTAGDPIEGAMVTTEELSEEGNSEPAPVVEQEFAIAVSFADSSGAFHAASIGGPGPVRTDADGRFRLDGIADGEVRVRFRHDAFRERTEEPVAARRSDETDLGTLVLERGATVRGTLRRQGGGSWMWATVAVVPAGGGSPRNANPAGPEGEFTIGGLDAGEYTVRVDYMLEPAAPGEFQNLEQRQHDAGTVRLGIDEVRSIDIVIP